MGMKAIDDARAAGATVRTVRGNREVLASAADDVRKATGEPPGPPDGPDLPDWPKLGPDALYGLAGDVVREFEPYTEADPAGILGSFLAAFGNAVGRGPHAMADGGRHGGNLFLALLGDTSTGRKGSAWHRGASPVMEADPDWARTRVKPGLTSGEGIIHAVRDASDAPPRAKDKTPDPGVPDKRLLAFEPELTRTLRVGAREGNSLTAVLRQAWDAPTTLAALAKTAAETATDVHFSLVAHIVPDEARRYLSDTEIAGGLGNRFLWLCVRRSQSLPDGGAVPADRIDALVARVRRALAHGRRTAEMHRDEAAAALWRTVYDDLTAGGTGSLAAMTARAAPQVLRLSVLYAVLDESHEIGEPHLRAALALWRCCEASVRYVFGDSLGDEVADRILAALRASPRGLSRTEITRDVFKGHGDGRQIKAALLSLEAAGLARRDDAKTAGRTRETWYAVANQAKDAKQGPGAGDSTPPEARTSAKEGGSPTAPAPLPSQSFAGGEAREGRTGGLSSPCSLSSQAEETWEV